MNKEYALKRCDIIPVVANTGLLSFVVIDFNLGKKKKSQNETSLRVSYPEIHIQIFNWFQKVHVCTE